ncbi:MAG: 50S ribosome-binding GTPase [Propionibacteriaceae bacterium]|nr:50S ribosome-binding GTPase [Propionibacteriaceae bacterium]
MTADSLAAHLDALARAAGLAAGRSDVSEARRVGAQASARLSFPDGQTVVALAGATGSGKSSLFNALSGTTLAEPGMLRPTTSRAVAAAFGTDAEGVLNWLRIHSRYDVRGARPDLNGLVLLDLPDHDSIERSHRDEVERLVRVVDQLIWVVDPQKYADAALHVDFLRPLAGHGVVARVVLNHIDQLGEQDRRRCMLDLRRILDDEGLSGVPLSATSAVTGEGIDELREEIVEVVRRKAAAAVRLRSDIQRAAHGLAGQLGASAGESFTEATVARVRGVMVEAAGVERVVAAVEDAVRQRGRHLTGWPVLSWLPGRRGGVPLGAEAQGSGAGWLALPRRAVVQRAPIASAVRAAARDAASGLPEGWRDAVLAAGSASVDRVADELGSAISATELPRPGASWWASVRNLQWVLFVLAVLGAVLLLVNVFVGEVLPASWALWLLAGGASGGVLLGLVSRPLNAALARRVGQQARAALTASVNRVADAEVIDPIRGEVERHDRAVELLARIG